MIMNRIAPHIRSEQHTGHMIADVLLVALCLCIFSTFNYGLRPVITVLLSILSAMVCEAICGLCRRQGLRSLRDGSAAVTGAVIGLTMSPMVAYWVPMMASAFAILVVKAPFGGYGRNIFNPAAAGIAIVSYCFPYRMFTYPALSGITRLPLVLSGSTPIVTEASLAAQLRTGATPTLTYMEMALGDFGGPIGATATLILLAAMAYLLCRRSASGWLILPYMITCIVIAWFTPCTGLGHLYGTAAQLCSGYVLFTGVFLLNDPVTTPRFWLGRLIYGVFTAILVMLLQRIGRAEAGSCFAILIANILSPMMDRWSWHIWRAITRRFRTDREVKIGG